MIDAKPNFATIKLVLAFKYFERSSLYCCVFSMSSSYYNIDDILAEDILIPVTNVVDFSHLAHLDPDYIHRPIPLEVEGSLEEDGNETEEQKLEQARIRARNRRIQQDYFLPEGSRIKMPLWAIEKWCMLGYVRVGIPRHYGRKIRERLIADPVAINLRYVVNSLI